MDAATLDQRARRERRATQLRTELVGEWGVDEDDVRGLSLGALFDLRMRCVNRMMQPGYGR